MRYSGPAVFAALGILLLSGMPCLADSGVLLPSAGGASQPNLGLTPGAADPSPQITPAVSQPAPVQPAPAPAAATQAAPPLPETPYAPQPEAKPAYSISISLAQDSATMTPLDIETLHEQLGLDKSRIGSQCHVGMNGMMMTTGGTVPIESNMTTTAFVGYNGSLTNAMVNIYAACETAPNPPAYSFMQKIGNYYGISLGTAFCDPGKPIAGNKSTLTIMRGPNGKDSCRYQ